MELDSVAFRELAVRHWDRTNEIAAAMPGKAMGRGDKLGRFGISHDVLGTIRDSGQIA